MIVDRGHLRWAILTAMLLTAAAIWYGVYASSVPGGPTGSSFEGLAFGIAGTAFVFFAALLGVRKKRPHYRAGRLSFWLKGHLWLGAIALPLICFHGGFGFGGPLTQVLMWLFLAVFVTGLFGLALQQFLPRLMTRNLEQETVYEQIDHVRRQLFKEAHAMIAGRTGHSGAVAKSKSGGIIRGRVVESRAAREVAEDDLDRAPLMRFLERHMRPFFEPEGPRRSDLGDPLRRAALVVELRSVTDPKLHPVVNDLEALCEQRAQLETQRRMHRWLHGWLLIHVPLSWTMVFLTAVHAVMALYY
ncbi:MAG: hypothetical protein ACYSX0_18450 [Planctomycetota bacterium]|jgi:hypothetical protein